MAAAETDFEARCRQSGGTPNLSTCACPWSGSFIDPFTTTCPKPTADELQQLYKNVDHSSIEWTTEGEGADKHIAGCARKDRDDPKSSKSLPLEECLTTLKGKYDWIPGETGCAIFTADGIMVSKVSIDACSVQRWTGENGDQCGNFKPSGEFIGKAGDPALCLKKSLTFFQWADAKGETCVAFNACEADLGKVDSKFCQSLPNPFAKDRPQLGYTWKKCSSGPDNDSTPFFRGGAPRPECAPDTLYSWKKPKFVEKYAATSSPNRVLDLNGFALYTWRTPIGSFGYARESLRMKLKPGVKFAWIADGDRDCGALGRKFNVRNTVFATSLGNRIRGYSEYFLCDAGPVESWSYDTPQHLEEMQREEDWMKTHPNDYDGLLYDNDSQSRCPWTYGQFDQGSGSSTIDWSLGTLNQDMRQIQVRISGGAGRVYFAKGTVPSLWNHFSTNKPGYFNPYGDEGSRDTWPERDPDGCKIQKMPKAK